MPSSNAGTEIDDVESNDRNKSRETEDGASELPPYAYVPGGGRPHPTRDPRGHSYGSLESGSPKARDPLAYGIRLFDHGYYWEAHEAWEQPFRVAARDSPRRDFYRALIALAAAGLKARQGRVAQAFRFAQRAERTFERLQTAGGTRCEGMDLSALGTFARRVASEVPRVAGDAKAAVQVLFSARLGEISRLQDT